MKRVVLIEPVSSGWKLIQKGKELGYTVLLATYHQDDRIVPEEYRKQADGILIVDTNNEEELKQEILQLHEREPIDAVLPGCDYYVPIANLINHQLGLPSLDPDFVLHLRYKHLMREQLAKDGVRVPKFCVITHREELEQAMEHVGLPCVIKPVDGSGSINVRKANSKEELLAGFQAIEQTVIMDLGRASSEEVLLEEYVQGAEYSVEGFVDAGAVTFVSITEKRLAPEPYFVEIGHIVSADLPPAVQTEILDYVRAVVQSLHVTMGPFHAEIRLSPNGPVLMEIAARLAGDRIIDLIEHAKGIDLYKIMYHCYLGLPITAHTAKASQNEKFAGIQFFVRPGLKSYHSIEGLEEWRQEEDVQGITITMQPGREIPEATSFAGRLGYILVTKDSYEELKQTLDRADRSIRFVESVKESV